MLAQLMQGIKQNYISHAYLFIGEKSKIVNEALEFAMAVNCFSISGGYPCGICLSCQKIIHKNHPDVGIIEPKGTSFKIDQVRELQKKVSYKHYEAKYKVFILANAHSLTVEAANSLLKLLEDPPSNTIFILLTENGDNILPTVLSRCQVIRFGDVQEESWEQSKSEREKWLQQAKDLVAEINSMDYNQLLIQSENLHKNKENLKYLFEALTIWLRDIAVAKITGKRQMIQIYSFFDDAVNSPLKWERALEAAEEVQKCQRLINQNANPRLVLDVLFLKLYRLGG